ncbi:MAG: hypothetical protein QHH19_03115 [Candidatus Thermoplasmatota archaeon]|jgi:hypothetical protein|nr:hypothetical protein [Candidatus Thermoplasmatota archaeon]
MDDKLTKKMQRYMQNDPDILYIIMQRKTLTGSVLVQTYCSAPLMNYPAIIDTLLGDAEQMKKIYMNKVDEETRKKLAP